MKNNFFTKTPRFISAVKRILLFVAIPTFLLSSACTSSAPGKTETAPVRIYNTHGKADHKELTLVNGLPDTLNPEYTVVENGLIRLTFPCNMGGQKLVTAESLIKKQGTCFT